MGAMEKKLTYKDAGVDIDAADDFIDSVKRIVKPTFRPEVLTGIGGFGSQFALNMQKYKEPVLVASTDGVGTKLRVAFMMNRHDTIGIDLVAMCVNDIIVQGAEPLFMLDYLATGRLDKGVLVDVVSGIAQGCQEAGCSLVGGETAEMPSFYADGEYDIAGFVVGAVERGKIIDGSLVAVGDAIIGFASSGVHSNGFSLVRKCIERAGTDAPAMLDGKPFRQALMEPTRLYVKSVLGALRAHPIKALAHITGGGLLENIPRVLPEGMAARLRQGSWPRSELFAWLQRTAGIDDAEMNRTFNNGIGMVVVIDAAHAGACAQTLREGGEQVFEIGRIDTRGAGAAVTVD